MASSGDSYTQTGFNVNGSQPSDGNPLGNPTYPYTPPPIVTKNKHLLKLIAAAGHHPTAPTGSASSPSPRTRATPY